LGRYGMKMKAGTGNGKLTTKKLVKKDSDYNLGREFKKPLEDLTRSPSNIKNITTIPKTINPASTVAPVIAPIEQPIVNPNAPKLGQKVMLGTKAATIDMVNGKLVFKYDDGSGIQEVRMAQTETIPTNINNNNAVVDNSQVPQRNFTTTSSSGITNSVAPKPKVITTKPVQTNSSPSTKQQGTTTNSTKKTTPAAKPKATANPNNTQWSDEELKRQWMLENNIDNGVMGEPFTITAPKYLSDIVPYSPEYSDPNPNNDNTRFNSKQHELANLNNKIAILKDEEKMFLKAKRNGAGMISWKDSIEHKKITDKIDALYTERNKVEKSKKSYSAYKSGGQLPSALKVSTPLKTIMDRKIEMYKYGGKYQTGTGSSGLNKKGTAIWNKEENKNMIKKNYLEPELDKPSVKGAYTPVPTNPNSKVMSQAVEDSLNNEMYKRIKNAPKYGQGGKMKLKTCKHGC